MVLKRDGPKTRTRTRRRFPLRPHRDLEDDLDTTAVGSLLPYGVRAGRLRAAAQEPSRRRPLTLVTSTIFLGWMYQEHGTFQPSLDLMC